MGPVRDRHCALLRRGSLMRMEALPGDRVACLHGMLWLTQERDPLDRILCAGESFVIDRPGTVLINALAHDVTLEYACDPARCAISRAAPGRDRSTLSLATEIGHIKARIDPQALRAMPAGVRREAIELEARRMRGQVVWLVAQHARRAAVGSAAGLAARAAALLARAWRALARSRRANASRGAIGGNAR